MDIVTYALSKKLVNGIQSGLVNATVDNTNCSITFNWTNGTSSTLTFPKPADGDKGDKGDNGVSVQNVEIREISNVRHLIVTLDDSTEIDAGILPNEQYDDTAIKQDISDLQSDKQDKADNSLGTTSKTVTGAINEIYGTQLDNVGFSSDYKNIILNRKNGLNPYTIPISAIIHNAKLIELNDIDITDIGNGKTLVYDSATKKHKYVDSTRTDEFVKMEASTDAHYLSDLIDKSTIVNDNGTLKVKKLDGQNVSITEINHLKGLTMNVMDLVNSFANGGVKVLNTPVATYADLATLDRSTFIDGISYIVYVLADETHSNAKTTYLCDKTSSTFFGNADNQRNFTTNPIKLASEVTGKLPTNNIDVDALWKLLTINDTYKTLTTNDEVFGTHGAKALYDELVTAIGDKANSNDLTTHTGDTDIHITTAERTKWNEVDNKVDKTDIVDNLTSTDTDKPLSANQGKILDDKKINKTSIATTIDSTSTDTQVPGALSVYNAIYNLVGLDKNNNILTIKRSTDELEGGEIHLETPTKGCTLIGDITIDTYGNYIRFFEGGGTHRGCKMNFSNMKRNVLNYICTTGVADVPVTDIKFTSTTNYKPSTQIALKYTVSNGICYVSGGIQCVSPNNSYITVCTLPKPKNGWQYCKTFRIDNSRDESSTVMMLINENGELELSMGTATGEYRCTFSYPVAES